MNHNEQKIFNKYTKLGYDVIKDGLPDMILLKDGTVEFVEVKYFRSELNPMQKRAFKLLKKHRKKVRVERVPKIRIGSVAQRIIGGKIFEM